MELISTASIFPHMRSDCSNYSYDLERAIEKKYIVMAMHILINDFSLLYVIFHVCTYRRRLVTEYTLISLINNWMCMKDLCHSIENRY